jgi:hypothetical protein
MAEQQAAAVKAEQHEHDHDHSHGGGCGIPSFEIRDLIVKEDVQQKAKELAELIYQSAEVQHYRRAEKQINGNERIQQLI